MRLTPTARANMEHAEPPRIDEPELYGPRQAFPMRLTHPSRSKPMRRARTARYAPCQANPLRRAVPSRKAPIRPYATNRYPPSPVRSKPLRRTQSRQFFPYRNDEPLLYWPSRSIPIRRAWPSRDNLRLHATERNIPFHAPATTHVVTARIATPLPKATIRTDSGIIIVTIRNKPVRSTPNLCDDPNRDEPQPAAPFQSDKPRPIRNSSSQTSVTGLLRPYRLSTTRPKVTVQAGTQQNYPAHRDKPHRYVPVPRDWPNRSVPSPPAPLRLAGPARPSPIPCDVPGRNSPEPSAPNQRD